MLISGPLEHYMISVISRKSIIQLAKVIQNHLSLKKHTSDARNAFNKNGWRRRAFEHKHKISRFTRISGSSGNCSSRQIFTLSSSSFSLVFFAAALLLLTFRYSLRSAATTTPPFLPPKRAIREPPSRTNILLPEIDATSAHDAKA